jgi:hypothetical protein
VPTITLYPEPDESSLRSDKAKRNCHFPPPGKNCHNRDKLILLLYGEMLESYRKRFVVLRGESCSCSWEPASDSCVQTHCTIYLRSILISSFYPLMFPERPPFFGALEYNFLYSSHLHVCAARLAHLALLGAITPTIMIFV